MQEDEEPRAVAGGLIRLVGGGVSERGSVSARCQLSGYAVPELTGEMVKGRERGEGKEKKEREARKCREQKRMNAGKERGADEMR